MAMADLKGNQNERYIESSIKVGCPCWGHPPKPFVWNHFEARPIPLRQIGEKSEAMACGVVFFESQAASSLLHLAFDPARLRCGSRSDRPWVSTGERGSCFEHVQVPGSVVSRPKDPQNSSARRSLFQCRTCFTSLFCQFLGFWTRNRLGVAPNLKPTWVGRVPFFTPLRPWTLQVPWSGKDTRRADLFWL